MNILIVEDDSAAALLLQQGLAGLGYRSDIARNGEFGLEMARGGNFDLWIVDVMMPIMNGLTMLRTLRDEGNNTPALVLSALGEVDERVEGLRSGGDDYLVKPYAFSELQARIEALLRRTRSMSAQETVLEVGDLKLDLLTRKVTRAGQEIFLKPRELRLLEYLMRHAGQVVTRTMLLENVWDYYFDPQTNVVDVHISRLRQQIDKYFPAPLLHTVRGEGYLMRVE
ncbi:MAG: response regulator transcription factor [Sulfurimicrobium sp.]|jgi:two-component system OmpR family response regulator|nr:response regulator transcription factor [Sulfurimicrobium sp.]MDZ7655374.1 response regulator transcription factor [Sulfurimicrobium sp.]